MSNQHLDIALDIDVCTCDFNDVEEHSCPYQKEINDNDQSMCTCCPFCCQVCLEEI